MFNLALTIYSSIYFYPSTAHYHIALNLISDCDSFTFDQKKRQVKYFAAFRFQSSSTTATFAATAFTASRIFKLFPFQLNALNAELVVSANPEKVVKLREYITLYPPILT